MGQDRTLSAPANTLQGRLAGMFSLSDQRVALAEQVFWFLALFSWLPLLIGFSSFVDYFSPWGPFLGQTHTLAIPRDWEFLGIAVVMAGLAFYLRRPKLLLCAIAPLAGNFLDWPGNVGVVPGASFMMVTYLYAVLISVWRYAVEARLRSWHFVLFGALVCYEVFSPLLFDGQISLFGYLFKSHALSLMDAVLLVGVVVGLRFLALIVIENTEFVRSIRTKALPRQLLRTAWLWLPVLIVYAGFTLFYGFVGRWAERQTVEMLLTESKVPAEAWAEYDLEKAMIAWQGYNSARIIEETQAQINAGNLASRAVTDQAVNEVSPAIHNSFPGRLPGTEQHSCGLNVVCYVMNGIKSMANTAYVKAKGQALAQVDAGLAALRSKSYESGDAAAAAGNTFIGEQIAAVNAATQATTLKVFAALRQISLLLTLYTLMMLAKTFLLVFARVIFEQSTGIMASLMNVRIGTRHGRITAFDQTYAIPNDRRTYLMSALHRPVNAAPSEHIPRWNFAPLPRLIAGALWFNALVQKPGAANQPVHVTVKAPAEFVQWALADGEQVAFRFRSLAGMSKGLHLRTHVSLNIASLVFGRVIHRIATGPGVIVLRTRAEAKAGRSSSIGRAFAANGMAAWHVGSHFTIQASLTHLNTMISDHNIEKRPSDPVVYDSAADHGSVFRNLMRMIRYFLLPI